MCNHIGVIDLQSESERQLEIRQFSGGHSIRRYNGVCLHVPSQYLPNLRIDWTSDPTKMGRGDALVPLYVLPDRRDLWNRRLCHFHVVCTGWSHGKLLLGWRSDEFCQSHVQRHHTTHFSDRVLRYAWGKLLSSFSHLFYRTRYLKIFTNITWYYILRRFSGAHDGDQGHRRIGGARGIRAQFGPQVPDNHFDDSIRSVPDFHVDGLPGCRPRAEWYPRCGAARLRSARSLLPQAWGRAHPLVQKATGARSDDCWYPSRCLGSLTARNQ